VISRSLTRRAQELADAGEAFVTATVVRVQRPTSVEPGNVALVRGDGTIEEGFVGGVCAQHSVRLYALKVLESGDPLLLKILPDPGVAEVDETDLDQGEEIAREEGSVTVRNPCLSGGAIEIFLEPVLPAPRVLVAGESPIVGALEHLGPGVGLTVVTGAPLVPAATDLALVVAAHGRDEVEMLRAGLEAGVRYVGLVASTKRGAAVIEELREDGVPENLLERIETPAGLDIGARTPAEIALSILARIVGERRRDVAPSATGPVTAVDPICGMTIVVAADTPTLVHDGKTLYFCCEACKRDYQERHEHAASH